MHHEFLLRKGVSEDFYQLYDIYMHPAVNRYLNFEIMPPEKFLPVYRDLMNSGDLYVYQSEHQIVATCIVIIHKRRCAHVRTLSTLAVHPDYHRKGIGTKFIKDVAALLKNQQVKRIDLGAESDNAIALEFYQRQGFQCEGIFKKYVKRADEDTYYDEHMMALILD